MNEIVPLFFGAALALVCEAVPHRTARLVTWVLASAACGVGATFLTGESDLSWGFVLIDVPLVAVTAALTALALRRLAHRHPIWPLRAYRRDGGT